MNVLIVLAHPEPKSFNGALVERGIKALTAAGHAVQVSDLYQMQFDPVSDRHNFTTVKDPDYFKPQIEELYATEVEGFAPEVAAEQAKLAWCDALVLQFPLWWFGLPAIAKGWVDRVLAMGKTYGGGRWYDRGVFQGKRALLSLTTGGGPDLYAPDGLNGDLEQILFPINHGILRFVGFEVLPPFVAWSPVRVSPEERAAYLDQFEQRLLSLATTEPIAYPGLDEYDERFRRKSP